MALLSLVTSGRVRVVSGVANGHRQMTHEAAEAISAGQTYRLDTNGKAVRAQATAAGNAGPELFFCIDGALQAGNAVTGVSAGLVDGFDLTAQAFGATIYLSDTLGSLGDVAGTVSTPVGRVTSVPYTGVPSGADKVLKVTMPG